MFAVGVAVGGRVLAAAVGAAGGDDDGGAAVGVVARGGGAFEQGLPAGLGQGGAVVGAAPAGRRHRQQRAVGVGQDLDRQSLAAAFAGIVAPLPGAVAGGDQGSVDQRRSPAQHLGNRWGVQAQHLADQRQEPAQHAGDGGLTDAEQVREHRLGHVRAQRDQRQQHAAVDPRQRWSPPARRQDLRDPGHQLPDQLLGQPGCRLVTQQLRPVVVFCERKTILPERSCCPIRTHTELNNAQRQRGAVEQHVKPLSVLDDFGREFCYQGLRHVRAPARRPPPICGRRPLHGNTSRSGGARLSL
ncbi:hypothetical protein JOE68_002114 [Saccharothrix algeriensis]|uniref:Secreted protein n=1 Tax=Saccharothrix algeriensis TaxID=173560 RepID=A0ABS2S5R2_9PSEU|nr:hypothetical protein [Saccharothrix algeriensis]